MSMTEIAPTAVTGTAQPARDADLAQLCVEMRGHIALMRDAGRTHLPVRFEVIEKLMEALER